MNGRAWLEMKAGLTFACMNLKKLAEIKAKWGYMEEEIPFKNTAGGLIWLIKGIWLWEANPRAALSTV